MTQELIDIVFLSLIYWGLSVLMLRIIILERRQRLYLFSTGYFAVSVGVGLGVAMKWLLEASLLFMFVSMSVTLWIILKESRECMCDPELREVNGFVEDINMEYTLHELVSADDFAENMDALIDKLNNQEMAKIGILHNDAICAVVVTYAEYQRLLHCIELYENGEIQ
jgi:hypothetical protein